MKYVIVSQPGRWPPSALSKDAVIVPASVPALATLCAERRPFASASSFLRPDDYQETWQRSFQDVWGLAESSRRQADLQKPNILAIYGYSLYLVLCQWRILWKALDGMVAQAGLTEIVVEPLEEQDPTPHMFYTGLFPAYFHEIATLWATARHVPVAVMALDGNRSREKHSQVWPTLFELWHFARRRVKSRSSSVADSDVATIPLRHRVYYLPYGTAGLGPVVPPGAIDATDALAQFSAAEPIADDCEVPAVGHIAESDDDPPTGWLDGRFTRHVQKSLPHGMSVFRGFRDIVSTDQRAGYKPALIMPSPYLDFNRNGGYMAEAFRTAGAPVASVQHGGNYRLFRRGGCLHDLTDFFGGHFFQWGAADVDESATYGIPRTFRAVNTGSPWLARVGRKYSARKRVRTRRSLRVLYVPTALDICTTAGYNAVWDQYFQVVRAVCRALDASGHDCRVKLLNMEESSFFGLNEFRHLEVIRRGGFVEYLPDADVLFIDALGGSPFYEALATDLSIVLYGAAENQEWDSAFLSHVRRRALYCGDASTYIQTVTNVLARGVSVFAEAGVSADPTLRDAYFKPTSDANFWRAVDAGLSSPSNLRAD